MRKLGTTLGLLALLVPMEANPLDYVAASPNIERAQDFARVAELIAPTIQYGIDGIVHVDGRTYRVLSGECWFVVVLKHMADGGPMTMDVLETNCPQ